jgi:methyl-accepting chemotaxis protein
LHQGVILNNKLLSSVGTKFSLAFALVLLIIVGNSLFAISRMNAINESTTTITKHWLQGIKLSGMMRSKAHGLRRGQLRLNKTATAEFVASRVDATKTAMGDLKTQLTNYSATTINDEEREFVKRIDLGLEKVRAENGDFMKSLSEFAASDKSDPKKFDDARDRMTRAMGEFEPLIDELIAYNVKGANDAKLEATALYNKSVVLTIALSIFALVISVFLSLLITSYIKRPLRAVVDDVGAIGDGDLSVKLKQDRDDEFGQLQASLVSMLSSLHYVIKHVGQSAQNLNNVSNEIASSNKELADRTEQSANNLRVTTASMNQLTNTVRQSNTAARNVNQLASNAADIAKKGGKAVSEVVRKMEDITGSSKQIAAIVDVIDGIAFQTNILALNAAVEAARAGEHGRGFAVVASEVRALAHRSADAAKEIKVLITDSVQSVESGFQLVHTAGSTMNEIVTSVEAVSKIIAEITISSSSQTEKITGIGVEIEELEHMTEQNAALVEESYATAEILRAQANQLVTAIGRFHL